MARWWPQPSDGVRGGAPRVATIRLQRRGLRLPSSISARLDLHAESISNFALTRYLVTRGGGDQPPLGRRDASLAVSTPGFAGQQADDGWGLVGGRCWRRVEYLSLHSGPSVEQQSHRSGRWHHQDTLDVHPVEVPEMGAITWYQKVCRVRHCCAEDGRILGWYSMLTGHVEPRGGRFRDLGDVGEQGFAPDDMLRRLDGDVAEGFLYGES